MKPALSIIFFTVSSGAGLGLLALTALVDLAAPGSLPPHALWRAALLGLVLVAAGLVSSFLHLANPANAWRSFSRFRTSWLSREAVANIGSVGARRCRPALPNRRRPAADYVFAHPPYGAFPLAA